MKYERIVKIERIRALIYEWPRGRFAAKKGIFIKKDAQLLGISCFYHDSAACLARDGAIVGADPQLLGKIQINARQVYQDKYTAAVNYRILMDIYAETVTRLKAGKAK